jgi:hypothetical protein
MIPSFLIPLSFIKNILGGKELIGSKILRFQRAEKRLRLGIIVTISPAAHAQVSSYYG